MGEPEPVEPTPENEPVADDPADWLVGAEEGLAAEMERRTSESPLGARPAQLRAVKIMDDLVVEPFAADPGADPGRAAAPGLPLPLPRPTLVPPPAPEAPAATPKRFGAVMPDLESGSEFTQGPAMTWEPGARSVPALRSDTPYSSVPAPSRDFPMDDAEERARVRAAVLEDAMAGAAAASRPHEVVSPEAFNTETVPMPWYIQFAHVVRTDRRLQVLLLVVLATLSAIALWPRGNGPMAISHIRRHPERYDGAEVQVAGQVGQVFQVGGGYAFYLIDRTDTLVVFTRTRVPVERRNVHVSGTMSNGWLDGHPTLALFESATAKH